MKNNKQMNTRKSIILFILLLVINFAAHAQDKIADKIIAVLGENIVLQSDIDGQFAQYIAQGYANKPELKCQILESLITQKLLQKVDSYYRVYVREGQTEVQVQDWTKINRTPNEYYFMFDTRDKIPNEYFIDIKVESSGEVNTYKRQIKFQIVNTK